MKLGCAQIVITPSLERPVFLVGFGQNRLAESVHDELYARAMALSDGKTTIILCALDLIGFFQHCVREVIDWIKAEHPLIKIVISSTHIHHGPDNQGLWGPDDKTWGSPPETVEAQIGAPRIFFSGAPGGMMTPDVENHYFVEAEEIGLKLAEAG